MSLAQRIERPLPQGADASLVLPKIAGPVDFRTIARRPAVPVVAAKEPTGSVRRESEVAFELINEVAKALPALTARCEHLETALNGAKEQACEDIAAAQLVAHEWQQVASGLRLQIDGLEKSLKAMKQRADAAESLLVTTKEAAEKSQHAAAEAECLSSLFQDKVISSFGIGSTSHPILETFRTKGYAGSV